MNRLSAVAVAMILYAHASDAQASVARIAGCYRLAHDTLRIDETRILALDTVRLKLDTVRLERVHPDVPPPRRVAPDTLGGIIARPRDLFRPGWDARADSVFITWTNGFAFVTAFAIARGDSLIGRIESGTDAVTGRPLPAARFLASRVACGR